MIPEIDSDSEWSASMIAGRWIDYLPELLPVGVRNIAVSDYKSEKYKQRKAIREVEKLLKSGALCCHEERGKKTIQEDYVNHHPAHGALRGTRDKTVSTYRKYVLGVDLAAYEGGAKPAKPKDETPERAGKAKDFIQAAFSFYLARNGDYPSNLQQLIGFVSKNNLQGYEISVDGKGDAKKIVLNSDGEYINYKSARRSFSKHIENDNGQ